MTPREHFKELRRIYGTEAAMIYLEYLRHVTKAVRAKRVSWRAPDPVREAWMIQVSMRPVERQLRPCIRHPWWMTKPFRIYRDWGFEHVFEEVRQR